MGARFLSEDEKAKRWEEAEKEFSKREWSQVVHSLKNMGELVMESMRAVYAAEPVRGEAFFGGPIEAKMILDYTGLRGSGANMYYSLVYQLPKWHFNVKKIKEEIIVTPTFADYYNITLAQKQKLEGAIKQGLASAMQAVTDYELLSHDVRRYTEILDYFIESKQSNDDHVLRTLFVDRVDTYTGEPFSLVSMAKRWPTIITDFVRMKTVWTDPEKTPESDQIATIMKGLEVSQAEATVLKTKNKLFTEWTRLILPSLKERYARLKTVQESRQKSIEEYRNWLKPYVSTFKSMKEINEDDLAYYQSHPYIAAGFGQSQSFATMLLWCWKPFTPPEVGKPPVEVYDIGKKDRKDFSVDPYDGYVKRWEKLIEWKYGVDITDEVVNNILRKALKAGPGQTEAGQSAFRENPQMVTYTLYYAFLDMYVELNLSKTPPPQGVELDNLVLTPIRAFYMSQNVLLLHLLEMWAREQVLLKEINTLIGSAEAEKAHITALEVKLGEKEEEKGKKKKVSAVAENLKRVGRPIKRFATKPYFIKKGPYEPMFYERGSKMYSRAVGPAYGQVVEFIKSKMHVG